MNVGVIGLGYVGLTLSVVAALKNHKVFGVEKSEYIKSSLRKNKAHFYEPGLDSLIARCTGRSLHVVDRFTNEQNIEAFIITVGTPLLGDQKSPNLDHIESALEQLRDVYTGDQLVILRSTISVGTTRDVVLPFLSNLSGKRAEEILVAFCPERTIEGKAVKELQELPQIIGANNRRSMELAEAFFREMTPTIIKAESLEAAELVKLFNNTYRDIHFALGNVFNEIAQSFGVNGVKLINTANLGYSRSHIPAPGFVGGPCLEKDSYILTYNMQDSEGRRFVMNARKYNESLEDKIVEWTLAKLTSLQTEFRVVISGLAFKGVPDTSDLRGSNAINIARKLKNKSVDLVLHDFLASKEEIDELGLGAFKNDFFEACHGQSLVLILNNNSRYSKVDFLELAGKMKSQAIVLDAWGVIDYFENADDHSAVSLYTLGNIGLTNQ